jgi:3-dehydroquinate synthase
MITVAHSRGKTVIRAIQRSELIEQIRDAWTITDENVSAALHLPSNHRTRVVRAGEAAKRWSQAGELLEWLAQAGATRRSRLAAVGGGVIGDLAGFAAAAYMRGIDLLQVPTSLLAMVDSSVGGKTGVDLQAGKNLAGAFWPASEVLISTEVLETLPQREWQCGSAEIWKYGAIMDSNLWKTLERDPISPSCGHLEDTIWRCIEHKRTVVEEDEYETTGRRAILNFGHTVGHAIEWALNYEELTHGEAIAIGMVIEAEIGEEIGVTEPGTAARIRHGMEQQGLPSTLPAKARTANLVEAMHRDKKAGPGTLGMSLLETVGTCKLVQGVSEEAASRVLARS